MLFDGSDLAVHHTPGETPYLLVVFGPAGVTNTATHDYFGRAVSEKKRIETIGFAAKIDNWYMTPEVDEAIAIIQPILDRFEKIIVLGMSMGAHTAIKKARRLRAHAVLAMSPKFSLDPEECNVPQRYLDENFRPHMRGMGIKPEDECRNIIVAWDPAESTDEEHAQLILTALPSATPVRMFYAGHLVCVSIAGSDTMKSVIDTLAGDTPAATATLLSRIRRSHPSNIASRLHSCVRKHPLLCYRMIVSPQIDRHRRAGEIYHNHGANGILYFMLAVRGYADEAVSLASKLTNFLKHRTISPEAGGDAPLPITLHTGDFQLVTDHGYLLAWDMQNRNFHGSRAFWSDNGLLPVIARRQSHGFGIYVRIDGRLEPLVLRNGAVMLGAAAPDGERFTVDPSGSKVGPGEKWSCPGLSVTISSSRGFLLATPQRSIALDSPNKGAWECLALLPVNS